MDTALEKEKLWKYRKDNKTYALICNTRDLALLIKKSHNDNYITDMELTRDNTYIALYKKTNFMFPLNGDINCLNWDQILPEAPPPVPNAANALITDTTQMANIVTDLARATIEECNTRSVAP